MDTDFDLFWSSYPSRKKVGKGLARKAWEKTKTIRPPISVIVAKLREARRSVDWTKDDGQYIPLPTTWLNQERWDDEFGEGDPVVDPWLTKKREAQAAYEADHRGVFSHQDALGGAGSGSGGG